MYGWDPEEVSSHVSKVPRHWISTVTRNYTVVVHKRTLTLRLNLKF